ncbi:DUF4245 domain-containing protein [Agrococcus sp. SL85]|uniref:DUF4245 domain-containing protein n=1 Tax=Agrococcus sp. SL85 TaxID=2995141 RepID=UPI00226CD0B1|nr:DUF4245 domain-containing protein [Agrococcus sp. SL85]WAC66440.1 DUF4245 domain-containing protein [Agrococcus sp. SL85]
MSPEQDRRRSKREPRIVAELGRPETPEEMMARKAAASKRHRDNQTFTNLAAAIVVCLGIVLVMVLVVLRPDMAPPEPVDVAAAASDAEATVDVELVAPALPEGWAANAAELRSGSGGVVSWYAGYVTPEQQFLSVTQAIDANPTWLAQQIRDLPATGERTVDGIAWTEHDNRDARDPGNLAYVLTAEVGASTLIVAGTAGDAELQQLTEAVSAELAAE